MQITIYTDIDYTINICWIILDFIDKSFTVIKIFLYNWEEYLIWANIFHDLELWTQISFDIDSPEFSKSENSSVDSYRIRLFNERDLYQIHGFRETGEVRRNQTGA